MQRMLQRRQGQQDDLKSHLEKKTESQVTLTKSNTSDQELNIKTLSNVSILHDAQGGTDGSAVQDILIH